MAVEALIGLSYQLSIKALFTPARLVTRDQKDSPALWVESESNAPNSISGIESQLLHVCVAGAFQSIDAGSTELRTKLFEQFSVSQQFVLHRF